MRDSEVDHMANLVPYNSVYFMYYKTVYFHTKHYFYYVSFDTSDSVTSLFLEVL